MLRKLLTSREIDDLFEEYLKEDHAYTGEALVGLVKSTSTRKWLEPEDKLSWCAGPDHGVALYDADFVMWLVENCSSDSILKWWETKSKEPEQ
jgi:hypothetical protein